MTTRHQIRTPRLRLRPLRLDDLDDLYRLWVDRGVRRYLWDDRVISRERARTEIERSIGSFEIERFRAVGCLSVPWQETHWLLRTTLCGSHA